MKNKYPIFMLAALLLIISLSGQAYSSYPRKIRDDLNREVIINNRPRRIVSLAPNITEIIYKLEAESRLVGVTKFCNYPQEAKEKNKVSVKNIESIIAQKPDLVLAAGIVSKKVINRLEDLGVKIVGYNPQSIEETIVTIEEIAKAIGVEDKGQQLAQKMRKELAVIKSKVEQRLVDKKRPTVFYEVWRQPLKTVGDNTFINDLIVTAGGKNIASSAQGSWPQYNLEKLLSKAPDVYLATTGSWKEKLKVKKIKSRPNYQQLKAVKTDKVFVFNSDLINRPGPRIIEALKLFVKAIHPQIRLAD